MVGACGRGGWSQTPARRGENKNCRLQAPSKGTRLHKVRSIPGFTRPRQTIPIHRPEIPAGLSLNCHPAFNPNGPTVNTRLSPPSLIPAVSHKAYCSSLSDMRYHDLHFHHEHRSNTSLLQIPSFALLPSILVSLTATSSSSSSPGLTIFPPFRHF